MIVVERKPVPIYEVECPECGSKIQYKASEVSFCQIRCPVCGVTMWVSVNSPVRYEEENNNA